MPDTIDVLHVTDLHFSLQEDTRHVAIKQILEDLKRLSEKGYAPAHVIFSGDMVNNPDEPDVYLVFHDKFIDPLLSVLGLSTRNISFCPGNHDISFRAIKKNNLQYQAVRASRQRPDALFANLDDLRSYSEAISKSLFEYLEAIDASWDDPLLHRTTIAGGKAALILLNSAFGGSLEGSAEDRGKLCLPTELITTRLLSENNPLLLTAMHHPLAELDEATTRELLGPLEKTSVAHFFGHVHQPRPAYVTGPSGSIALVQGGALWARPRVYNGYSISRFHVPTYNSFTHYRTYWPDRSTFDSGLNVSEDGTTFPNETSRTFWTRFTPRISDKDFLAWLTSAQGPIIADLERTLTEKNLSDTFVAPRMTVTGTDVDTSTDPAKRRTIRIDDVISDDRSVVIGAAAECGGTSLLKYLAIQSYKFPDSLSRKRVPAYVDIRKCKPYENSVRSALRQSLPEATEPRFRLDDLHDQERLTILIDEVDLSNSSHVDVLRLATRIFGKARFVIALKIQAVNLEVLKPAIPLEDFLFIQVRHFNRARVRLAAQKWNLPSEMNLDRVVEEIMARFGMLGIPLSGPYISFYLSIISQTKGYVPINSSNIIENFVEVTFDKYRPEFLLRREFDYKNQVFYLSFIAEQMCRSNTYIVLEEKLEEWTKTFFEGIGLRQDARSVIDFFVNNRAFEKLPDESIRFRYNIFISFFIASRMKDSAKFKAWVLENLQSINFTSEIDLYCGLVRNDEDFLIALADLYSVAEKAATSAFEEMGYVERLENLTFPRGEKEIDAFFEHVTKQLTGTTPDAAERDQQVADGPTRSAKPELSREKENTRSHSWTLVLRALTVAIKNLEHIPAAQKSKHLAIVLKGWAYLTHYSAIALKQHLSRREVQVGDVVYTVDKEIEIDIKFVRLILTFLPVVASAELRSLLGSQKLEIQLADEYESEGMLELFFRKTLYSDLRLPGYMKGLNELADKLSGREFMLEVLLVRLREGYLRFGIPDSEEVEFRRLVAEVYAEAQGLKGKAKNKRVAELMQELETRRALAKLKDRAT